MNRGPIGWEANFFALLERRQGRDVTLCAHLSGVSRRAIYYRIDTDEAFASRYRETRALATSADSSSASDPAEFL